MLSTVRDRTVLKCHSQILVNGRNMSRGCSSGLCEGLSQSMMGARRRDRPGAVPIKEEQFWLLRRRMLHKDHSTSRSRLWSACTDSLWPRHSSTPLRTELCGVHTRGGDGVGDAVVSLLHFLGLLLGVNKAILGLTVLAWGNSKGDLSTNKTPDSQINGKLASTVTYGSTRKQASQTLV